jgi:hypothetical protein
MIIIDLPVQDFGQALEKFKSLPGLYFLAPARRIRYLERLFLTLDNREFCNNFISDQLGLPTLILQHI